MTNTRLKNFVNTHREKVGISSQRELSVLMGRDETAVSKAIAHSTNPSADFVLDLAVALKVSFEDVLWAMGLIDNPPEEDKEETYLELKMAFKYMDAGKRKHLLSYARHLMLESDGEHEAE